MSRSTHYTGFLPSAVRISVLTTSHQQSHHHVTLEEDGHRHDRDTQLQAPHDAQNDRPDWQIQFLFYHLNLDCQLIDNIESMKTEGSLLLLCRPGHVLLAVNYTLDWSWRMVMGSLKLDFKLWQRHSREPGNHIATINFIQSFRKNIIINGRRTGLG